MELVERSSKNTRAKVRTIIWRTLAYAFLLLNALICLFLFYLLIVNASKSKEQLQGVFKPTFGDHFFINFWNALFHPAGSVDILKGTLNSFLVALFSSILTTYFSALTAYAIHAYTFKGKKIVAGFILAIMMIPSQVASVGFVKIAFDLELTDQLWLLIVPSIAAPSTYFYMLQHLKANLPLSLVEASRIDGSSEFMTFNRIVLPVMKPAIAVQFIFSFVASWNNYYMPGLLLKDDSVKTLPVMLATLRSQAQSQADVGQVWMVILLSILPVCIVYLILSKFIIKGVTAGSVKG